MKNLTLSRLGALLNPAAPHLTLFTACLLLLLFGYEIFNFSFSIDEEAFGPHWARAAAAQGRWGAALLTSILPPLGNIPMLSTVLFCMGLGVSACVLSRILFRNHPAQFAFVSIFVSHALWPHIAEFNISSWCSGIGSLLLTLSLLLVLARHRIADILAVCLVAVATGISEMFFVWFLVLLCILHLSVALGSASPTAAEAWKGFAWLRSGVIAVSALLLYFGVQRLLFIFIQPRLGYVQGMVRLFEFTATPSIAIKRTLWRLWAVMAGFDRMYLGYGRILTLLPLLGLLIVIGRLLWRGPLTKSQRLLAGASLAAALALALSPIVIGAGRIPVRTFIALVPLSAFLAAVAFAYAGPFKKLLYIVLAAALFVSAWLNVSLFHSDHLARQRDQLLAARIMARVDRLVPDPPPARVPFVVVGLPPAPSEGGFHRLEVFGDSFFEHDGGNPRRIVAYLRTLGVTSLEPRQLAEAAPHRATIEAMPIWPAPGSVAFIGDLLVIKLGPLPRA